MPIHKRNTLIALLLLVASLGLVTQVERTSGAALAPLDFTRIPYAMGPWTGKDIPVTADVTEILGTNDVLMRQYDAGDGSPQVLLVIVYSDTNRDTFHPPEMCYVGSGIDLHEKNRIRIPLQEGASLGANELLLKEPRGYIRAWYWFSAGSRFIDNYYRQQAHFFKDAVLGRPLRGGLIRVSVQGVDDPGEEAAHTFIRILMPFLNELFT